MIAGAIALALLLGGGPTRADPMPAPAPPNEVARGHVDSIENGLWIWVDGTDFWIGGDCIIRHEHDGPDAPPLTPADCLGRMASVVRGGRTVVTLIGGQNPRDFALALSAARWVADARPIQAPRTPPEALAMVGLGADRWTTREAAQRILERRGMGSVPALVRAEKSADIEIRERVKLALRVIRDGE